MKRIVSALVPGLDFFEIVPVPDLREAQEGALAAMERGYIPERYGWTRVKTARAYALKGYGAWARSIFIGAKYYLTDEEEPRNPAFGRIARFTWRNNYRYLVDRLALAVQAAGEEAGRPVRVKALSNYTAIPEKPLFLGARAASRGRNSVLALPRMGSLFTIGEAFTDLEVEFDATVGFPRAGPPSGFPGGDQDGPPRSVPDGSPGGVHDAALDGVEGASCFPLCGGCRVCRDSCPAGAIPDDGVVNVKRCLQYLSEDLVPVPVELREAWGSRLYGCSVCVDACPLNARLVPWAEKHGTGFVGPGMDLLKALSLPDAVWRERVRGNQIGIRDRRAILKNAVISLGWLEYRKAFEPLAAFLAHDHEVLRACAAWAVRRAGGARGKAALERLARVEENALVREEIERLL